MTYPVLLVIVLMQLKTDRVLQYLKRIYSECDILGQFILDLHLFQSFADFICMNIVSLLLYNIVSCSLNVAQPIQKRRVCVSYNDPPNTRYWPNTGGTLAGRGNRDFCRIHNHSWIRDRPNRAEFTAKRMLGRRGTRAGSGKRRQDGVPAPLLHL